MNSSANRRAILILLPLAILSVVLIRFGRRYWGKYDNFVAVDNKETTTKTIYIPTKKNSVVDLNVADEAIHSKTTTNNNNNSPNDEETATTIISPNDNAETTQSPIDIHTTQPPPEQHNSNVAVAMHNEQQQQPPQYLVQVGANDGIHRSSGIVRHMLFNPNAKAILVETNPAVFELLQRNVRNVYEQQSNLYDGHVHRGNTSSTSTNTQHRILPLNVLVCPEDNNNAETSMKFWMIDEDRLEQHFPDAPHWIRYEFSSISLHNIMLRFKPWLKQKQHSMKIPYEEMKPAVYYTKAIHINCTSFAHLLQMGGFEPSQVNLLAVDAEGHDGRVVTEALSVPDFLPETILFEQKVMKSLFPGELERLLELLEQRGYTTDCANRNNERGYYDCERGDVKATLKGHDRRRRR